MRRPLIAALLLTSLNLSAGMANETSPKAQLPKVFIIGDSISLAYTPVVAEMLRGQAVVKHCPANAGPTMRGVANIDRWLGNTKWDVILFNFGLWDMYGWRYEKIDRSPPAYERRLDTLAVRLKKTGAKLIWATTTPACPEGERKCKVKVDPATEAEYLAAALRVMKKHNIPVNDLHAFMKPKRDQYAIADNDVHFKKDGNRKLGEQIANQIKSMLLVGGSATAAGKDESATGNGQEIIMPDVITQKEAAKLKAIRNSYGSIPNLDSIYKDRTHNNGLPYHVYVPKKLKPGVKYPLVTFLHGYSDLTIDTHKGFPKGVWSLPLVQSEHPHILFVPRYRTFDDMWVQDNYRTMVIEAMDQLIREFNSDQKSPGIDTSRLYLTGFSQGGVGTWNFIKHYPHKFAAAAPLSGFSHGPQNVKQAEALRHLPIWIFNGDGDKGVSGSRLSYQMLKRAEARDVRYHEYKKQGHVIDDFAYFTEGFMDWLFAQKRTAR